MKGLIFDFRLNKGIAMFDLRLSAFHIEMK